jgi:hypothetical protein
MALRGIYGICFNPMFEVHTFLTTEDPERHSRNQIPIVILLVIVVLSKVDRTSSL